MVDFLQGALLGVISAALAGKLRHRRDTAAWIRNLKLPFPAQAAHVAGLVVEFLLLILLSVDLQWGAIGTLVWLIVMSGLLVRAGRMQAGCSCFGVSRASTQVALLRNAVLGLAALAILGWAGGDGISVPLALGAILAGAVAGPVANAVSKFVHRARAIARTGAPKPPLQIGAMLPEQFGLPHGADALLLVLPSREDNWRLVQELLNRLHPQRLVVAVPDTASTAPCAELGNCKFVIDGRMTQRIDRPWIGITDSNARLLGLGPIAGSGDVDTFLTAAQSAGVLQLPPLSGREGIRPVNQDARPLPIE